ESYDSIGLCITGAEQRRGGAQHGRGTENGVRGAVGFVVGLGGGLMVEIVKIFNCAGANAQEGEDQEDGGEATQDKREYAAMAAGVNSVQSCFIWLESHAAVRWRRRLVCSRCWWAMLFSSVGSLARS